MEYALQVVGDYNHVLAVARVCEEKGAAAVSMPDHYLFGSSREDYTTPVYDSLMQAAALGRDTAGIEIVMLVSPITFRHPAVYAKAAITIDEMSGGRFVLGLGTGWHDDEHEYFGIPYPDRNERFEMLEDALGYVSQFFEDPEKGFESSRYRFEGVGYEPRARQDMRILVGGGGPKRTPRLAGTYGGEYSIAGSEPEGIAERVERAHAAAEAAGRNPDELFVTISAVSVSGHTDAEITENVGRVDRNGRSGKEARKAWEDRGFGFHTWEELRDRFGRFADAGVQRSYLQLVAQDVDLAAEALEELG